MIVTVNLNDEKLKALRTYLGVAEGHITQLEKDYLVALGASGDTITDLWMDYLVNVSAYPQVRGHLNDMWYAWLGDLGFTGSLNDRWLQYWDTTEDVIFDRLTEDGAYRLTEDDAYRITN